MKDIELIVKIDTDVYTRLFDNGRPTSLADGIVIDRALRLGKPLEKHDEEVIKAVINMIMPYCSDDDGSTGNLDDLRNVLDDIESLPSVQPKQNKGEWIEKDDKSAVCTKCNRNNILYGDFCKWCGADMRTESGE